MRTEVSIYLSDILIWECIVMDRVMCLKSAVIAQNFFNNM